jgi:hypothetical protein
MTTKGAMFVFIAGLILTMGGLGGVEHSISNDDLVGSMLLAILGLLAMYAGTLGLRNSHYYD